MTKIIAVIALVIISVGLQLGNYWWTFGLWPRSWVSFSLFALASVAVSTAFTVILKDDDTKS
jgi:hypothetical protein